MPANAFLKFSKIAALSAMLGFVSISATFAAGGKSEPPGSSLDLVPKMVMPQPEPDPKDNPMLARYLKDGMQLYYLGSRSGLDGWFLVKDDQMQVAYTTADKQSIVIGALFGTDGHGVTEDQIQGFAATHPELAAAIQKNIMQEQKNALASVGSSSSMNSAAAAAALNAGNPFGTVTAPPVSPGERLIQNLQIAAGANLGNAKAPLLYMIMDPNCPHCQATWKGLRDAVFKNTLQIRLVPIGRNEEEERAAAQLLNVTDPLNAWDKYVGGDKTQLTGTANALALGGIKANHTLVDNWSIKQTPYMAYRAKDGKVKIIEGEPQKVDALLTDIGS